MGLIPHCPVLRLIEHGFGLASLVIEFSQLGFELRHLLPVTAALDESIDRQKHEQDRDQRQQADAGPPIGPKLPGILVGLGREIDVELHIRKAARRLRPPSSTLESSRRPDQAEMLPPTL